MKLTTFNRNKISLYVLLVIVFITSLLLTFNFSIYSLSIFAILSFIYLIKEIINYISYYIILNDEEVIIYSPLSIEKDEIKNEIIKLKDINEVEIKRIMKFKDLNKKEKEYIIYSGKGKPYLYLNINNQIKKVELHKYSFDKINIIENYFIKNNKIKEQNNLSKQETKYYNIKNKYDTLVDSLINGNKRDSNTFLNFLTFLVFSIIFTIIGVVSFVLIQDVLILILSIFYYFIPFLIIRGRLKEKSSRISRTFTRN